jgi:hypothetical protein
MAENSGGGGPLAFLILLLAIGLALGGGHIGHGGGGSGGGTGAGSPDPCYGQPGTAQIWSGNGIILDCDGFRHVTNEHPLGTSSAQDVLDCIGNVLSQGMQVRNRSSDRPKWEWKYQGGKAYVILDGDRVWTAYADDEYGGSNDWAACGGA